MRSEEKKNEKKKKREGKSQYGQSASPHTYIHILDRDNIAVSF